LIDGLIVGLGNPGAKYDGTRHNFGFMALDAALAAWGGQWKTEKTWKALTAKTRVADDTVLLVKPQTYMNLSGDSVGPLARYYQLPPEKVLVVVDDINLPFGRMRYRASGSAGGHNGLKSIEQHLGTSQYPRLRLGVGLQGEAEPLVNHVLSSFTPDENQAIPAILTHAVYVMAAWFTLSTDRLLPLANSWVLPTS
jgi:peptidyl-tRNA hydrolase, PTH1 family